jgi:hypothetical protein
MVSSELPDLVPSPRQLHKLAADVTRINAI